MGALGQQRRDENTFIIESEGGSSTVNGVTIKALWQDAQVARVQLFLSPNEWGVASFEVRMPYYALAAPYNVKNGVEVIRNTVAWHGVVRDVTVEDNDDVVIQVNCLVVLTAD